MHFGQEFRDEVIRLTKELYPTHKVEFSYAPTYSPNSQHPVEAPHAIINKEIRIKIGFEDTDFKREDGVWQYVGQKHLAKKGAEKKKEDKLKKLLNWDIYVRNCSIYFY